MAIKTRDSASDSVDYLTITVIYSYFIAVFTDKQRYASPKIFIKFLKYLSEQRTLLRKFLMSFY